MGMPYEFVRALEGKRHLWEERDRKGKLPEEYAKYLMQDGNMRGKYLGACLDASRWGAPTTVMYRMDIKGMIEFIQEWFRQNQGNEAALFHEKPIDVLYKRFELPRINHDKCPAGKDHTGTVLDRRGNLRCAHQSVKRIRPSFISEGWVYLDKENGVKRVEYSEERPFCPISDEFLEEVEAGEATLSDEDRQRYDQWVADTRRFEEEEPEPAVTQICYAIISEGKRVLSLEEIIRRLNLEPEFVRVFCNKLPGGNIFRIGCTPERIAAMSPEERESYHGTCLGHEEPNDKVVFDFDGWDLAYYVQRCWEQLPGTMPCFEKDAEGLRMLPASSGSSH
jgi:hypothetical protein